MSLPTLSSLKRRCQRSLGRQRGFTLIELMTVVVIIAALAVVTIPQITRRMKDRRTQQAAQMVTNLYRNARMHAMGRGGAVLVRYTNDNRGVVTVREAIQGPAGGACQRMPVSGCTLVDWNTAANFTEVTHFNPANYKVYHDVWIEVTGAPPDDDEPKPNMDVCFSPLGRAFVRYGLNAAWGALTGVPSIAVTRKDAAMKPIGLIRTMLLLPNGTARLGMARGPES